MRARLFRFLLAGIGNAARRTVAQVRDINRRYRTPHIAMTPMVRVCLVMLRAYLLLLVAILVYKFVSVIR